MIQERQEELDKQRQREASEISAKRASFFSKRSQMEVDSSNTETTTNQLTESERALLKVINQYNNTYLLTFIRKSFWV